MSSAHTHHETHPGCCAAAAPSHDAIAHRAFDIYVKTGSKKGHCKENWLQAEHELKTANHRA